MSSGGVIGTQQEEVKKLTIRCIDTERYGHGVKPADFSGLNISIQSMEAFRQLLNGEAYEGSGFFERRGMRKGVLEILDFIKSPAVYIRQVFHEELDWNFLGN